jgi:hypothetical protein
MGLTFNRMKAMALRFFHIPSHGDAALEAVLNQVLSTFRIIKVDRNFVATNRDQ